MEISRNLSKQPFPTDSGRITLKNSLRDYVHLLKFPDFRLLVLKCAGSYSQVFTVIGQQIKEKQPIWFQKTSALNRVKLSLVFTASQLPRTKLIHSSPPSNGPFCHRQVWFYFLSMNPPCEDFCIPWQPTGV